MKKLILVLLIISCIFILDSCTYKFVDPVDTTVNPNDTVSFSSQIVPIFTENNNCTSCHKAGATSPDLTASAAYNELISKNLVNTSDAAQSKIYNYCEPATASHSWKKYTNSQAQLVLLWITQGAKNN